LKIVKFKRLVVLAGLKFEQMNQSQKSNLLAQNSAHQCPAFDWLWSKRQSAFICRQRPAPSTCRLRAIVQHLCIFTPSFLEKSPWYKQAKMVTENVLFTNSERCCKLVQWKVKPGDQISKGRILLHFSSDSDKPSDEVVKLKAIKVGTVVKVFLNEGDVIKPG
jgi:hypothetical protein